MPVAPVNIVKGVSLPCFPMRPWHGVALDRIDRVAAVSSMRRTHVLDRKLNGDRVLVGRLNTHTYAANRHGSWYSYGIENKHKLDQLPSGTVLDGEVWKKEFYPFDVLALNGVSLCFTPIERRRDIVKKLCASLEINWLWDVDDGWMSKLGHNAPVWEGVVAKKLGSPYLMLGSDARTSDTWSKMKWV